MRGAPLGQVRAGALQPGREKAVLIVHDLPERAQPYLRRAGAGLQLLRGQGWDRDGMMGYGYGIGMGYGYGTGME